jgi:hypothetical protein
MFFWVGLNFFIFTQIFDAIFYFFKKPNSTQNATFDFQFPQFMFFACAATVFADFFLSAPPSSSDKPSLLHCCSSSHFSHKLACAPVFFKHQSHMGPCRFFNFDFLFSSSFSRFFRGWHSTAMFFKKSNNNQKSSHSAHIQLLKGCEDLT